MKKNLVAGIATIIVLGLMILTAMDDGVYHGGNHAKVIEDFGDGNGANAAVVAQPEEKDDRAKEMDKLGALRDKAGNAGAFKVTREYKSKCASCHGVNGSGFQNGKAMMGPKLIGQTSEQLFKDLVDFKAGRKENMIMKGLLMKLDEEALQRLSDEIGEFPAKKKANEEKNKS